MTFCIKYASEEGYYDSGNVSFYDTLGCYDLTYEYVGSIYDTYQDCMEVGDDDKETNEGVDYFTEFYSGDTGNLHFTIKDSDENIVFSNYESDQEYGLVFTVYEYGIECYVKEPLTDTDDYFPLYQVYRTLYPLRYWGIVFVIISGIVWLISMICLSISTDPPKEKPEDRLGFWNKIPMDLLTGMTIIISCIILGSVYEMKAPFADVSRTVIIAFAAMVICLLILLCFITLVKKLKSGRRGKDTLTYRLYGLLKKHIHLIKKAGRLFEKLPIIGKLILIYFIFEVLNYLILVAPFGFPSTMSALIWIIIQAVFLIILCIAILEFKILKEGASKIAQGDLDYKINTARMFKELKAHGEVLNNIGEGISAAVGEKIKSERFKAELITNVSHDIKTPLTSIINYVDLLKKENIKNKNAVEYIEVLDRQSARLKKLTQDLIDASKASTGSITMEKVPTNLIELVNQSVGEYDEQFSQNNLEPIISVPHDKVEILADGRLMWRVFDNLLNNIYQYSQPGTRVYFNILKEDVQASVIFKNISRDILNISSEELMERFVRGDDSRKTQGSGLGLSIAKSLVELQQGSLELYVDGDLFKVIMTFDLL